VFVEGRFKTREFEGRDGQKRTSLEITADSVVKPREAIARGGRGPVRRAGSRGCGSGAAGGSTGGPSRGGGGGGNFDDTELDDLPF